jgi:putative transposase
LQPLKEFKFARRNLPHLEQAGSDYFITFKTARDLALSVEAKNIVLDSMKFHNGEKYHLHAGVVMATHVHLILHPLEKTRGLFHSLTEIMHSIKSYSAYQIQRTLSMRGVIWMDEYYDRIIRNDDDYLEKLNYIVNNPLKSGTVDAPENYKWLFIENEIEHSHG